MKKIKGISTLEIIVFIGLVSIIAAAIIVLIQRAIDEKNSKELSNSLLNINTAMTQMYRGRKSYPPIDAGKLDESRKLMSSLIDIGKLSTADSINPFNRQENIIITSAYNGVPHKAFLIRVRDLSVDQCKSVIKLTEEQFKYIRVMSEPESSFGDIYRPANAPDGTELKTPLGPNQLDLDDSDHLDKLCTQPESALVDIFFGNT